MVERRAESRRKVISKRTVWGRQGFSKVTLVEVMQMSVASNEATGGMIAGTTALRGERPRFLALRGRARNDNASLLDRLPGATPYIQRTV